jgi:hypothetical protein
MRSPLKRYGVKIDEPICQPGVKIPIRTGVARSPRTASDMADAACAPPTLVNHESAPAFPFVAYSLQKS